MGWKHTVSGSTGVISRGGSVTLSTADKGFGLVALMIETPGVARHPGFSHEAIARVRAVQIHRMVRPYVAASTFLWRLIGDVR